MLIDSHIQEDLSRAYIQAIAARAGVNLKFDSSHDYGVDGTFKKIYIDPKSNRRSETGRAVDFQLKASINWEEKGETNEIIYDLEAKNYNDLVRERNHQNNIFVLILFCMPKQKNLWLERSKNELKLKHCCYYYRPEIGEKESLNTSSQRIKIPGSNLFSEDVLMQLLEGRLV